MKSSLPQHRSKCKTSTKQCYLPPPQQAFQRYTQRTDCLKDDSSWHGKMLMSRTGTMQGKHDKGTMLLFAESETGGPPRRGRN
uniref:RBL11 n=1 Tax=Arundo donax TaxID=35708 RepID=A0A0A9FP60_ARUDO